MSFAFYDNKIVSVIISDPGADDTQVHLFRAPEVVQIVKAYAVSSATMGAGTAPQLALHNYGTGGTAVEGTIALNVAGTASPLTANTPAAFTLADADLEAGEWVVLDVQEINDWSGGLVTLEFELRPGKSAT